VGTKSSVQIRSHAQKHFAKVERGDAGTETISVPPPRYKRKSAKTKVEQQPQQQQQQQQQEQQQQRQQQREQQPKQPQVVSTGYEEGGGSEKSSKGSAFYQQSLYQGDAASHPASANAATLAPALSNDIHAQLQVCAGDHFVLTHLRSGHSMRG
jgi:hypothetical protein